MSDERLTKDVRDRLREMMTSHILNGDSVLERALDECDALERERDEVRRLAAHWRDLAHEASRGRRCVTGEPLPWEGGDLAGLAKRESGGES